MTTILKELCSADRIAIASEATLREAADMMCQNKKGAVVILEDSKIAGILSERDIVGLLSRGIDFEERALIYATKEVTCVRVDRTILHALIVMAENEIRRVVVIDKRGRLAGLVTQRDIVSHLEDEAYRSSLKIRHIFDPRRELFVVAPEATIGEALRLMNSRNVSALPVFDGERVVGMVSERTALSCAALKTPLTAPVKTLMRTPIVTVSLDTLVMDAVRKMEANDIRRLVIVENNECVGIVTQKDVLKNFESNYQTLVSRKLRQAKDMFNLLPELAMEILDNGDEQLVVWANRKAIDTLGKTIVDSPIASIFRKGEWRLIHAALSEDLQIERAKATIEDRLYDVSGFLVRSENIGERGRIKLILRDITADEKERKSIERELDAYGAVIDSAADIMLLYRAKDGAIKIANETALRQFGLKRDEMLKRTIFDLSIADRETINNSFAEIVDRGRIVNVVRRYRRANGSSFPVEIAASKVVLDGADFVLSIARDISEKLALEEEIKRRNEQLTTFHTFNDSLNRCASIDEAFGVLSFYLKNAGVASAHIYHIDAASRIESSATRQESLFWKDCLSKDASGCKATIGGARVIRNSSKDFGCPICKIADDAKSYMCVALYDSSKIIAIVSLSAAEEEFFCPDKERFLNSLFNSFSLMLANLRLIEINRELSIRDPLTRLFNRRFLTEFLGKQVENSRREERPLSIIMIDLDDFKRINDMFGHDMGDRVLIIVSRVVEESLRRGDIAARFGGEEFILALPNADKIAATMIAGRIKNALAETPIVSQKGGQMFVTASFGVATLGEEESASDAEGVVRLADARLYEAKANGKNRIAE